MEGHVDAVGDRNLLPDQPFRSGRVVVEQVADVAGLPPCIADRVPGVDDFEVCKILQVGVDRLREAAQQPRPISGRVTVIAPFVLMLES